MNSHAVDEFVKRGWVDTRGELVQKLRERNQEYTADINHEIFKTEGPTSPMGPNFVFVTVFLNAYEVTVPPPIVLTLRQSGALMDSLDRAGQYVLKACA